MLKISLYPLLFEILCLILHRKTIIVYSNDNTGQNITMLKFGDVGLESRDIPTLQSYLAPLPLFFLHCKCVESAVDYSNCTSHKLCSVRHEVVDGAA